MASGDEHGSISWPKIERTHRQTEDLVSYLKNSQYSPDQAKVILARMEKSNMEQHALIRLMRSVIDVSTRLSPEMSEKFLREIWKYLSRKYTAMRWEEGEAKNEDKSEGL